jgi:hypothetical protein
MSLNGGSNSQCNDRKLNIFANSEKNMNAMVLHIQLKGTLAWEGFLAESDLSTQCMIEREDLNFSRFVLSVTKIWAILTPYSR